MRKQTGIILVLALLLPVLAGCQSVGAALNQSPAEQTVTLTKEQALNIALTDAGLTKDEIRDLDVELDKEFGKAHYDIDFEKGTTDYDYEIDAQTGEILHREIDQD